ncbi:MAG TPA: N-acetylmuramic acid 6-phosphate etherase [Candidatus Acidoferrum sp.]|nr:N-acetylmuramic acid 6-phosphate etherase [Candidatus Acidoferrum sp.]
MSADVPATELEHPETAELDAVSTETLVALLIADQRRASEAVAERASIIARIVDRTAQRLRDGGRLHYIGAGTSGRLGVIDAAELYPTFRVGNERVAAHIAGGVDAVTRAIEGAEDDREAGQRLAIEHVRENDVAFGLSASGSAPFVVAALAAAAQRKAYTVAIVNVPNAALARVAEDVLELATGPEALTGSTRLKAGTAQKIALNTLSTAIMVRLGKVFGNSMVDVVVTNRKLRARAIRLVESIAGVDRDRAESALDRCDGRVKVAIVALRRDVDAEVASSMLERAGGSLRVLL